MSIKLQNLCFNYGEQNVLSDLSFKIKKGSFCAVMGANGAGKSTLFKCILGLNKNYTGNVFIDEQNINKLTNKALAKKIAYIPQNSYTAFNYSVIDMVLMGTASNLNQFGAPLKKDIENAKECMKKIGIEHLCDRNYTKLSGGERQLVLIARALAQNAKIIIMDEPISNLDYANQIKIMLQVKKLASDGYTILQAIHSPDQVLLYFDEMIAIKNGKIIAQGKPSTTITETLIEQLYGIKVTLQNVENSAHKVCVPETIDF